MVGSTAADMIWFLGEVECEPDGSSLAALGPEELLRTQKDSCTCSVLYLSKSSGMVSGREGVTRENGVGGLLGHL